VDIIVVVEVDLTPVRVVVLHLEPDQVVDEPLGVHRVGVPDDHVETTDYGPADHEEDRDQDGDEDLALLWPHSVRIILTYTLGVI